MAFGRDEGRSMKAGRMCCSKLGAVSGIERGFGHSLPGNLGNMCKAPGTA